MQAPIHVHRHPGRDSASERHDIGGGHVIDQYRPLVSAADRIDNGRPIHQGCLTFSTVFVVTISRPANLIRERDRILPL